MQSAPASGERVLARQQASLVILKGHAEGMEYPLGRTDTVIGRDPHARICLTDPLLSREHAVLLFRDGVFVLQDLGSRNGTYMNGVSIKKAFLRHGDTFRLGGVVFQFVLQETARTDTCELA